MSLFNSMLSWLKDLLFDLQRLTKYIKRVCFLKPDYTFDRDYSALTIVKVKKRKVRKKLKIGKRRDGGLVKIA